MINEGSHMNSNEELHKELAKLHGLLAETKEIDEETRAQLVQLSDEIRMLAAVRQIETDGDADAETGPLRKKLDDFVFSFETHHPQLTAIVARIADALARLGI